MASTHQDGLGMSHFPLYFSEACFAHATAKNNSCITQGGAADAQGMLASHSAAQKDVCVFCFRPECLGHN